MTRFAARNADIVGLVPRSLPAGGLDPSGFSAAAMDERVRWLVEAADDGNDPERSVLVFAIGASLGEVAAGLGLDPSAAEGSPHLLVGDTAQMIDALVEARERWGLSYFVFFERDLDRALPVVRELAAP